nr:MAG TPA: hypothetical protein [Caudoviricetes sp.]
MTGNAAEVIYYGWINYVKSKMNNFLLLYISKKGVLAPLGACSRVLTSQHIPKIKNSRW